MSTNLQRAVVITVLATAFGLAHAADVAVKLTGAQEVPAITTDAQGSGTFTIGNDMSVSGSITTSGIMGTAAHIHMAEMGKNGPVAIALTKTSDNVWSVPAGSKLTDEQYTAFKAGNLYVNVHSDAHKPGEIRAQLKP
ncbi:MAG TPA: CHRD domain-containing protein [Steroidobacteraceae bacterium]